MDIEIPRRFTQLYADAMSKLESYKYHSRKD